jgi:hypothetical protein
MRRIMLTALLSCGSLALLVPSVLADVIIRGPFGQIVVRSPVDVRVGPGVFVGVPPRPGVLPGAPIVINAPFTSVIVGKPAPVIAMPPPDAVPPDSVVLPPPTPLPGNGAPGTDVMPPPTPVTPAAVAPHEFVKTFKPSPTAASYEVVFLHPLSHKAVPVTFNLPEGNPSVRQHLNTVVFDYGSGRQVEIRFQLGGKVEVSSRQ